MKNMWTKVSMEVPVKVSTTSWQLVERCDVWFGLALLPQVSWHSHSEKSMKVWQTPNAIRASTNRLKVWTVLQRTLTKKRHAFVCREAMHCVNMLWRLWNGGILFSLVYNVNAASVGRDHQFFGHFIGNKGNFWIIKLFNHLIFLWLNFISG